MNIFKKLNSLPSSAKRSLGLGIIVALTIALPLFIWALMNLNFNQKERAASGEPIDIAAGEPIIGLSDAKVTIVAYFDFQCPYCKQFMENTLSTILANYPNDVRFVYKDFPVETIHPLAKKAAIAGQCAFTQGKFWEMHNLIYAKQDTLVESDFNDFASLISLNTTQFNVCYTNETTYPEVQDDMTEGLFKGVSGTPTFFVGKTTNFGSGQKVEGAQPFSVFESLIENLLQSSTGSPTATATSNSTATPTSTALPTATPTEGPIGGPGEPNSCGGTCGSNYNCKANLYCYQGYCRNPICSSETDCDCSVAAKTVAVTSTSSVTAKSETSGSSVAKSTSKGSAKPTPTYTSGMTLIDKPSNLIRESSESDNANDSENKNVFVAKYAIYLLLGFILIVIASIIYAIKKNRNSNIPHITPPTNI